MYLRLELENAFVHQKFVYDFQKGLTVISGLNGKGKSLIPEMMEFACWGVQALRGKAEGYKGVKVALELLIRGIPYRIERTANSASLYEISTDGANKSQLKVATGVTPVNQKVAELFGYSYEVFKVTNVSRQGEIELMGQMKPTARKALIDETIGLSKIEALADWAKVQEANANAAIKALEAGMGTEPEPLSEAPAEVTTEQVQALQAQVSTFDAHSQYLVRPVELFPHAETEFYDGYVAQQKARDNAFVQIKTLTKTIEGFPAIGTASSLHERDSECQALMDETNKRSEAQQYLKQIEAGLKAFPKGSTYTDEQLEAFELANSQLKDWYRREKLRQELIENVCPKCDHRWHEESSELDLYKNLPEDKPIFTLAQADIDKHKQVNAYQADRTALLNAKEVTDKVIESTKDNTSITTAILQARQAVQRFNDRMHSEQHRLNLIQERDAIAVPEDLSEVITAIQNSQLKMLHYKKALSQHLQARVILDSIPSDIKTQFAESMVKREAHVLFLEKARSYSEAMCKWIDNTYQLNLLISERQDWKNVRQAIIDLRVQIKGFLLPSLNDVASRLINLMSKGWLTSTAIDEDFELRTDGKLIDLLAGAGKTLTNLALRIGLGQVLTNSVFSVLVLDEADAGVDIEKAPMVAEAMKALTGVISQVIIISHKQGLTADHRLEL